MSRSPQTHKKSSKNGSTSVIYANEDFALFDELKKHEDIERNKIEQDKGDRETRFKEVFIKELRAIRYHCVQLAGNARADGTGRKLANNLATASKIALQAALLRVVGLEIGDAAGHRETGGFIAWIVAALNAGRIAKEKTSAEEVKANARGFNALYEDIEKDSQQIEARMNLIAEELYFRFRNIIHCLQLENRYGVDALAYLFSYSIAQRIRSHREEILDKISAKKKDNKEDIGSYIVSKALECAVPKEDDKIYKAGGFLFSKNKTLATIYPKLDDWTLIGVCWHAPKFIRVENGTKIYKVPDVSKKDGRRDMGHNTPNRPDKYPYLDYSHFPTQAAGVLAQDHEMQAIKEMEKWLTDEENKSIASNEEVKRSKSTVKMRIQELETAGVATKKSPATATRVSEEAREQKFLPSSNNTVAEFKITPPPDFSLIPISIEAPSDLKLEEKRSTVATLTKVENLDKSSTVLALRNFNNRFNIVNPLVLLGFHLFFHFLFIQQAAILNSYRSELQDQMCVERSFYLELLKILSIFQLNVNRSRNLLGSFVSYGIASLIFILPQLINLRNNGECVEITWVDFFPKDFMQHSTIFQRDALTITYIGMGVFLTRRLVDECFDWLNLSSPSESSSQYSNKFSKLINHLLRVFACGMILVVCLLKYSYRYQNGINDGKIPLSKFIRYGTLTMSSWHLIQAKNTKTSVLSFCTIISLFLISETLWNKGFLPELFNYSDSYASKPLILASWILLTTVTDLILAISAAKKTKDYLVDSYQYTKNSISLWKNKELVPVPKDNKASSDASLSVMRTTP